MRVGRSGKRAIAASIGLHVLLAFALLIVGRWSANRPVVVPPLRAGIDTRVDMTIEFSPQETAISIATPDPPVSLTPPDSPVKPLERTSPSAPDKQPPESAGPQSPLVRMPVTPQTLPPEMLALLKKPTSPANDVVEIEVTPTPLHPQSPVAPPAAPTRSTAVAINSVPAESVTQTVGKQAGEGTHEAGKPIHGALSPGQTIVYVLDASGSMGQWGKFDLARKDLIATLSQLPATARFQLIVYQGFAYPPLPAPVGGTVMATSENVNRMIAAIRALKSPQGRSNHIEGMRMAVGLNPDFLLILTDADDLPLAAIRAMMQRSNRPATLCLAKVGAEGVARPIELR